MKLPLTIHTIVKNEDRFIWYALNSVIYYANEIFIYDTGSTDKTLAIINTLNSPKIILEQKTIADRKDLVRFRQEQLDRTHTPWFMLLDGDEIWPRPNIEELLIAAADADKNILALFNRTRNCVGDVFHYLPESKGHYNIQNITGHLNIRLIRNTPGLKVEGEYPLETYTLKDVPIQNLDTKLKFVDTWYLHTTHLPRSTQKHSANTVIDRLEKRKFRLGLKMFKSELPEVFWQSRPTIVPPPITNRWLELIKWLF